MSNYVLDANGEPVHESDILKWAAFMWSISDRTVEKTKIGNILVSTVFLGTDHNFNGGPPVLWETMIFGGDYGDFQERYTSRVDAIAGHAKAVQLVKDSSHAH